MTGKKTTETTGDMKRKKRSPQTGGGETRGRKKKYRQEGPIGPEKEREILRIYETGIVMDIVNNIGRRGQRRHNLDDLCQDIYLALMERPTSLLKRLNDTGDIRWYVARMVMNQIHSGTSPYYKIYRKPSVSSRDLPKDDERDDDDRIIYTMYADRD